MIIPEGHSHLCVGMRSSLPRRFQWYICVAQCCRLSRRRLVTSGKRSEYGNLTADHPLVECSRPAEADLRHVTLVEQFITQEEEDSLMGEIAKSLRRLRYQYEHWDGVRVCKHHKHYKHIAAPTAADVAIGIHTWCIHLSFLLQKNVQVLSACLLFIKGHSMHFCSIHVSVFTHMP